MLKIRSHPEVFKGKEKEVNELHRQLGKRTAELEWAAKKLKSLGYNDRRSMIDTKLKTPAIVRQCALLGMNRSNVYYESRVDDSEKEARLRAIDGIYTQTPFYGYRKVHRQLVESGFRWV